MGIFSRMAVLNHLLSSSRYWNASSGDEHSRLAALRASRRNALCLPVSDSNCWKLFWFYFLPVVFFVLMSAPGITRSVVEYFTGISI
jgi:hypothetical protein